MSNYNVGDMIKLTRISLGMSQEQLCDGICSIPTMNRIENGKCSVKKEIYQKLMERMGRNGKRNFCSLYVDDFDVLDIKIKADTAIVRREYEKAEKYINELKPKLKESVINKQYILLSENIINYRLKRILKKTYLRKLEEAIKLTISDYNELLDKVYPFMDEEISILINISNAYKENKNYIKSIEIMKMLLRSLDTGYMGEKDAIQYKVIIMCNMAKAYGCLDEYGKAIEIGEEAIKMSKKCKRADTLANLYAELAWDMIQQIEDDKRERNELEICKKYMRQGYALATIYRENVLKNQIKGYYKEYFKEEIYFSSPLLNGVSPNKLISSS